MGKVCFPILNIEISLSKVAFSLGKINVYWYAIIIALAILIFLITAKRRYENYLFKYEDILDLTLLVIPVSIICARLYYIAFAPEIESSFKELFNLKTGGLAIYGGIIGGTVTTFLFCKKKKIPFFSMTDFIVPYLALGQSLGRWGNFINVEAYGIETTLPWRMEILNGQEWIGVHPTFLYESIFTLGIFIFLSIFQKKQTFIGEATYWYLILYSFERMIVEGLRSDSLLLFGVRISQMLSAFILVIFCVLLAKRYIKGKKNDIIKRKQRKKEYET